jgi:hypothetical protein
LNVSDFHPETPYLFSKNLKVIHSCRIAHLTPWVQTQAVKMMTREMR